VKPTLKPVSPQQGIHRKTIKALHHDFFIQDGQVTHADLGKIALLDPMPRVVVPIKRGMIPDMPQQVVKCALLMIKQLRACLDLAAFDQTLASN
jgi:hypothetical protein